MADTTEQLHHLISPPISFSPVAGGGLQMKAAETNPDSPWKEHVLHFSPATCKSLFLWLPHLKTLLENQIEALDTQSTNR